jgi:hypothetical protein
MSSLYRSILNAQGSSFASTNSFEFDGSTDFISVADNSNLSFGNGTSDSPFSISAWVKVTTNRQTILTKYDGTNAEYWFGKSGNLLFIQVYNNGSTAGRRNKYISLSGYEGQWIHVVGAYNGQGGNVAENGLRIYLNGIRQTESKGRVGTYVAMTNTTAPVEIGRLGTNYGEGHIDELAVFDVELSSTEVTNIYNSGVPNNLNDLSNPPISWWRMGEAANYSGGQWTLTDQGSGGNDGTSTTLPSPPSQPSTDVPT